MRQSSAIHLLPVSNARPYSKIFDKKDIKPVENSDEVSVALSQALLNQLLDSGVVSANQLRPLNANTKQFIRQQCLQGCQDKRCDNCIFQKQCQCFSKDGSQ